MTAEELRDYLVARLVRSHGGTRRLWRIAVGNVTIYDRATHPHCNWAVSPSGEANRVGAIERLIDDVRTSHPFITG